MDLQTLLNNAVKAERAERLKSSPQLTLGEVIAVLESSELEYENHKGTIEPKHVRFDFEYIFPTGLDSWRGSYDELAITFSIEGKPPTGKEFLDWLKESVGKSYEGWKGGEYTMGKSTPLWVANSGNSGQTALVRVDVDDFGIKLNTLDIEY